MNTSNLPVVTMVTTDLNFHNRDALGCRWGGDRSSLSSRCGYRVHVHVGADDISSVPILISECELLGVIPTCYFNLLG